MRMLLTAFLGTLLISGCTLLTSTGESDKARFLPEPKGDRDFLVGWKPQVADKSAKVAHEELTTAYNTATLKAAGSMGWEIEKRPLMNPSNVSTTSDPAQFRNFARYGIHAPDIGCKIIHEDNGHIRNNCGIAVLAGGITSEKAPDGLPIPVGLTWAFDQSRNHSIALVSEGKTSLPRLEFAKRVSAELPNGVFMYIRTDGGHWLHNGKRIP